MRQAPPVRVEVLQARLWRVLDAGLPALTLAVVVAWGGLHLEMPAWTVLMAAFVAAALASVLGERGMSQRRVVAWDGERWTLDGVAGAVRPMIDLGAGMLLAFDSAEGRRVWLALDDDGDALQRLRASLFAAPRSARAEAVTTADRDL